MKRYQIRSYLYDIFHNIFFKRIGLPSIYTSEKLLSIMRGEKLQMQYLPSIAVLENIGNHGINPN